VAIETPDENEMISTWMQRFVSIGGQRNGWNSFYWVEMGGTDEKMIYQNFAPGKGLNGAEALYVYMMPSGQWANYDHGAEAFVCESGKNYYSL